MENKIKLWELRDEEGILAELYVKTEEVHRVPGACSLCDEQDWVETDCGWKCCVCDSVFVMSGNHRDC